jgi:hypothetical protein
MWIYVASNEAILNIAMFVSEHSIERDFLKNNYFLPFGRDPNGQA